MRRFCLDRDGQIHQIIIGMDPHMEDGLHLHLVGLGIVGSHLVPLVQFANGLFALGSCHQRGGGEAPTGAFTQQTLRRTTVLTVLI